MVPALTAPEDAVGGARVTRRPLVVVGGGEHARVVVDAARASGDWEVVGIVDADPVERTRSLLGVDHLGDDAAYLASVVSVPPDRRAALVLGIGSIGIPVARRAAAARYEVAGAGSWATVVHPSAWVSTTAVLGPGVVVLAGAVVNAGAVIEAQAIVNSGAVVEHDAVVGAFAHVGPGAIVGGGARLGAGAIAGMGCLIRDHVTVGPEAVLGMGAAVTADVPAGVTVVGVPARPMGAR
jgi:sugar O-acyltransferase (sialic acid O-acetyltransferase NeuD family)